MVTEDTNVKSFRGVLHFDVKIVRPQQEQEHNNEVGNANSEEMDTISTVIDISDQKQDNSGITGQVVHTILLL